MNATAHHQPGHRAGFFVALVVRCPPDTRHRTRPQPSPDLAPAVRPTHGTGQPVALSAAAL